MATISPAVRISFGLVVFTLSAILMADLFGLVPKKNTMLLEKRQKICESLAVQLSVAASYDRFEIVKSTLEIFVDRNNEVIAASMKKVNNEVVAEYGSFVEFDNRTAENVSTENVVVVPIYAGEEQWGSVNIEFKPLYASGLMSVLTDSIFGILLFVALTCYVGYMFILKKSLSVLDPKSVMPDRVCAAFNTLSEGVMIVDDKEQIIMTNTAFAKKVNREPDDLQGVKISTMQWKHLGRSDRQEHNKMPWRLALDEGEKTVGTQLNLETPDSGIRSLSTNCAPIQSDEGKVRGALVTFDDVTEVEETNLLLENAVTILRKNEIEIKHKNNELEILATRDSLTGCYNRRAFFDMFEKEFDSAKTKGGSLSVVMVDIDFFKSINDRFGHSVGDDAIRLVSDVLNQYCDNDNAIVSRYGGEEFCMILPGSDEDEAFNISERLRQAIQATSYNIYENDYSVTASFGLVSISKASGGVSDMLECADKALYVAKESGRNRVIRWGQDRSLSERDNNEITKIGPTDFSNADHFADLSDEEKILALQNKVAVLQSKLSHLDDSADAGNSLVDPVTRLPSMLIFVDRINQAITVSKRTNRLMSVVTLNIDMFSRINETMGQAAGDEFLHAAGNRLKDILRGSDTVAFMSSGSTGPSLSRLRNDEFVLLLTGLENVEALTYIIQRIQNKFKGKIEVSGNDVYVTTSIGLAVYPEDGETAEKLIENSGSAQKQAKKLPSRSNFQFYSSEFNNKVIDQMQIEIDLHNAIENDQFVLYYQPKVDVKTGSITSVESLIRWQHPVKGIILPDDFIPVAEKTGMFLEIGNWCLREACYQARQWVDMGMDSIRVSVNISALEFCDENFKGNVLSILKNSGLNARNLELEITESTIMSDQILADQLILDLHTMGISITLDDFGTGYSSLSNYGNLEIDWLKLDKSFLSKAMKNDRSRIMYSSIVDMVHSTGVKVVAEGIETEDQYSFVNALKVDEIQGYMISEPVNAEAMTHLLFPDGYRKIEGI